MKSFLCSAMVGFVVLGGCDEGKQPNQEQIGKPQREPVEQPDEQPTHQQDKKLFNIPTEPPPGLQVGFQVGMVAPEIEAEDIDGQVFKLSDYRGKVVVLDFWGDW